MADLTNQFDLVSGDTDIEASGGKIFIARTDPDRRAYGAAACTPVEAVALANALLACAMEYLAAPAEMLPENHAAER
jgi:hypothetical protein